jgi:hypothetical protein
MSSKFLWSGLTLVVAFPSLLGVGMLVGQVLLVVGVILLILNK